MNNEQTRIYYVYRHVRLDKNVPFYIGIGTVYTKRSNTLKGQYTRAFDKSKSRNTFWKNITSKTNYKIQIIYETSCIKEIKLKEKYFIKLYGLKNEGGTLCNIVNGGYGIEGFRHSEETRKKIGEASKTRVRKKGYKLNLSDEGRKNISNSVKNRVVSEDTRQKMSDNLKGNIRGIGHYVSPAHKKKISNLKTKTIYQYDLHYNLIAVYKGYASIKKIGFNKNPVRASIKSYLSIPYKGFYWSYSEIVSSKDSSVSIST
jgi:hypothetical protein